MQTEQAPCLHLQSVIGAFIIIIMYYTEKLINGILYYQLTPNGEWQEVKKEHLSERVVKAEKKVNELRELIEKLQAVVS
jgi:hypothetical protein